MQLQRALAFCLFTLVALVACGSPDDQAQAAGFCDTWLRFELAADPDIDFHEADEQEIAEGMRSFASDLAPTLREVQQHAPDDLNRDVQTLTTAFEDVAEGGDPEQLEDPGLEEAYRNIHTKAIDECDWPVQQVVAIEYGFENVPATLPAGITSFELENQGVEFHELALFRKNPGVDTSAQELLELPDEQAFELVSVVGAAFAGPGDHSSLVRDLESGDFVMACFIPVGTTSFEFDEEPGEDRPPHFVEGMFAEFSVRN